MRSSVGAPVRVLTFSTLFPNDRQPSHGVFVETRLRHLLAYGGVESRVVAPIPWFPFRHPRFGRYAEMAAAAREERRFDIDVLHPRYPVIPKVGMLVAPQLLYAASLPVLRRVQREGFEFDVIDAHYFYPDGVAAVRLAKALRKPVTVTARGTDIHQFRHLPAVWRQVVHAASKADAVITVCDALRRPLLEAGVDPGRMFTFRNGVDLALFRPPEDRSALRHRLGFKRRTLVSVGRLISLKGHDLVIDALGELDGLELVIVGSGPEAARLERQVAASRLNDRVRFVGPLPQRELADYSGAADALVLASSHEGWPNVLLESMACGTPVVATAVGGVPEVVVGEEAGRLVAVRSGKAIAAACRALFNAKPARPSVRDYAERFGWEATSALQLSLFNSLREGTDVRVTMTRDAA